MKTVIYQHIQAGTLLRILLGTTVACLIVGGITFVVLQKPPVAVPFCIAAVVVLVSLVAFHSLSVTVTDEAVEIRFGPGWIRKTFPLDSIAACKPVQNSLGHGWGIHWCGKDGWVYNVSGFEAVEIEFKNGKKARIGTDQPRELAAAIKKAMDGKLG
jgi:hypothetical protein